MKVSLGGVERQDPAVVGGDRKPLFEAGAGWQRVTVVSQDDETRSRNGHEQLTVRMEDDERSITDWIYPAFELQLPRLRGLIEAAGFDIPSSEFDVPDVTGREVDVFIGSNAYNGEERPRVESYAEAGAFSGVTQQPAAADESIPF